ncbi:MAG: hypothetical protein ACN6OC_09420 [Alcaligenes sp.]
MGIIYITHPADQYENSPAVLANLCQDHPKWSGEWQFRLRPYEKNASLVAKDFCSIVLQSPGPIVMLQPVQAKTLEEVRRRIGSRLPIVVDHVATAEALEVAIDTAIQHFLNGEPLLALDVAVALLLMRKLDQERMWTGNAKGYMWASDIPKGRGLDVKYESRIPNVLNILLMNELVVYKISKSKKKYALNPQRREDIYEILKSRKLPRDVEGPLLRHPDRESVRVLDILSCYDDPLD